jgi:hypothetical protein
LHRPRNILPIFDLWLRDDILLVASLSKLIERMWLPQR